MRLNALVLFAIASCTNDGPAPSVGTIPRPPTTGPTATCTAPGPGCPCAATTEARDCFLPPIATGDGVECNHGVMYCVDGRYTDCNTLRTYRIPLASALLADPQTCNPCDPTCAVVADYPNDADLTTSNSDDVRYDGTESGLTLTTETTGGSSSRTDTDRDGVADVADECSGPGWRTPCDGNASDDGFYHELAHGGPSAVDPISVTVQIRTADVYFLMDTTGSMGGEIENLQDDLTRGTFTPGCSGGIIGAIRCAIPDAWFGVGRFDDYPVSPYGGGTDVVYENLLSIGSSTAAAQTAVNALGLHWGNDGPESNTQALYAIATGDGLGPYLPARTGCPAGTFGYPCFRDGTVPIVVHFTDAPFHNGPTTAHDYAIGTRPTLPATATAVTGNEIRTNAHDLGNLAGRWISRTGNLCSYRSDYASCETWATGGDAVFKFTLTAATTITMTLDGTTATYPVVTLLDSMFRSVTCDSWPEAPPEIVRTLAAGTYYVIVDNYNSGCGTFRLNIGEAPTAASASYPVTWSQTTTALSTKGVRVITVQSCAGAGWCVDGIPNANSLGNATSSVTSAGAPLVFPILASGLGLSTAVVTAIVDLANYVRMDVAATAIDNTATTEDERALVAGITAVSYPAGRCLSISGGSTFQGCLPGTSVAFSVAFRNTSFMHGPVPKVYDFWISVLGDGTYELARVPVRITIPARDVSYSPAGTFVREYDTTVRCDENHSPEFNTFEYDAATPSDTRIDFAFQTATTSGRLDRATAHTVSVPGHASPIDLETLLAIEPIRDGDRYLRVTATLHASTDRASTPVLRMMRLKYHCVEVE
jgi:hypothetical protein